jgi:hypothetical protein
MDVLKYLVFYMDYMIFKRRAKRSEMTFPNYNILTECLFPDQKFWSNCQMVKSWNREFNDLTDTNQSTNQPFDYLTI